MTLDEFASRLDGVKRNGDGIKARCPAHEDRHQSLTAKDGDKGLVLKCHAGCENEEIVRRLGLEWGDIFYESRNGHHEQPENVYGYVDEDGETLYEVLRFPGKEFRQRHRNGNSEWVWNMQGVRRVLYRLPQVLEAKESGRRIYVVEGEKDADAIVKAGSTGTTNVGGSQAWKDEYSAVLEGAHVYVVADKDDPGIRRARQIAKSLEGKALSVKLLMAKSGKDTHDHLAAGHELGELLLLDEEQKTDGIVLVRADTVKSRDPEYVNGFHGFVPYGGITALFGEPGVSKSTLAALVGAQVTSVGGTALFVSIEGDPALELRPRLEAAGAVVNRCFFPKKLRDGQEDFIRLPDDVEDLREQMKAVGARLLVVDPLNAHLGGDLDTAKDSAVRAAINPLHAVARDLNAAVVVVSHTNKDRSHSPMRRAGGTGLHLLARSCLMMGVEWESDARILSSFKNSWGPTPKSARYLIQQVPLPGLDETAPKLAYAGDSHLKAAHLLYDRREER